MFQIVKNGNISSNGVGRQLLRENYTSKQDVFRKWVRVDFGGGLNFF